MSVSKSHRGIAPKVLFIEPVCIYMYVYMPLTTTFRLKQYDFDELPTKVLFIEPVCIYMYVYMPLTTTFRLKQYDFDELPTLDHSC